MAIEIEIKAWIRRPEETEKLIQKICAFEEDYVKEDIYFLAPNGSPLARKKTARSADLRLRRENAVWLCTSKNKTCENGLEVNEENEFTLSDGKIFAEILTGLGCRESLRKVKRGKRYSYSGLNVEAGEVEGLGLFVEAEKVLPAADDSEIRAWEKTLRDFLAQIGVRPEDIESRPYSLMLAQGLG